MTPLRPVPSLAALATALIVFSASPIAGGALPASLPLCPVGLPASTGAPVAVPSTGDPTACRARPTRVEPAAADGLPVPTPGSAMHRRLAHGGYHHLGVTTAGEWGAVLGRLTVRDPGVRAGTYDFVATRFMAKRDTGGGRLAWLEAGWAETGWSGGGAQRIYAFDSAGMSWLFFDDYRIGDGDQVWIHLQGTGARWRAWLWWGDRWQLLASATLPAGTGALLEQYVEVHRAPAAAAPADTAADTALAATPADPPIAVPPIRVDRVEVRATAAGAALQPWRAERVPTLLPLVATDYCLDWETRYDAWSAGGCPVTVQE